MRPSALLADCNVIVVSEFSEGKMKSKTLIALVAAAIVGVSSTAMARGGGGCKGGSGGAHFHGQFHNQFHNHFRFGNRFLRNQALFNGWGWGDWGWGPYSDNNGGGNSTVVIFPQARPQVATGSNSDSCRLSAESFNVPSAAGGTAAVQVVGCR